MAENFSWTRMAGNILPAAVGALAGGGAGGMGALPGALYGLGSGARYDIETGMQRDKMNRDIAIENQRTQQAQQRLGQSQQRIDLDREQLAAQRERWAMQDRAAEEAMKLAELERRKVEMELDQAARSEKSFIEMRSRITDPAELAFLDRDPKSYLAKRYERASLAGAGPVLETFVGGIERGEGQRIADVLGREGVQGLIESSLRARTSPRKYFDFKPATEAGGGFLINEQSGEVVFKKFDNMSPSLKQDLTSAHQIMTEARQQVEAQFRGMMGQMDLSSLGKTPEQRAERFQKMINDRASELAADRGVPGLFGKSRQDLQAQALARIEGGEIKSESDLVAFFAVRGAADPKKLAAAVLRQFAARSSEPTAKPPAVVGGEY